MFGLLVFSFPIGAYLFFSSDLGGDIDHRYPLGEFEFVKSLGWQWAYQIEIGHVFAATWAFFVIMFAVAALGPNRSFLRVLSPIMAGTTQSQDGNYLVHAIRWFSIIIILSLIIDGVQQLFGITTAPPEFGNDLTQLLSVSFAPIIEEVGFRIILVGVPVFLLYSRKASARLFARSLWSPSTALPISDTRKAVAVIIASAVLFGVAHVLSDQGWTSGKIAQATMSGIIIGWVYVRYGFVAAILIHWATNYVVFSYGYLVANVNNVRVMDAFSHSLLQTIEAMLVVAGALSLAMVYFGRKRSDV